MDSVPEFRRTSKGHVIYKLRDMVFLLIIGRMGRCKGRPEIIAYGKKHLRKLQSMGMFKEGIPSESTLCRVEAGIDSVGMADLHAEFAKKFQVRDKNGKLKVVAIDGKCMRGTLQENGKTPDILGAYSPSDGLTLATEMCEKKSNEITAAPKLIDKIDLKGKVVTADAMFCQKDILNHVTERDGHFLVEVKANQKKLTWGLEDSMAEATPTDAYVGDVTLDHGRIESRRCRKYKGADLKVDEGKWGSTLTFICVETSTIQKRGKEESSEKRIYMTDLDLDARTLDGIARGHWSIETMHWSLDTNMRQDSIRRKHVRSARNLDTIQRLCLSLLSIWRNNRKKKSDKRLGDAELLRRASFDFPFLMDLLSLK